MLLAEELPAFAVQKSGYVANSSTDTTLKREIPADRYRPLPDPADFAFSVHHNLGRTGDERP